jgi:hypothetical protein
MRFDRSENTGFEQIQLEQMLAEEFLQRAAAQGY